MKLIKVLSYSILLNFLFLSLSYSEILKEIKINGNVRITDEIISMFSDIELGQDVKNSDINNIIKNLYETNFFNNVSVTLNNSIILINVDEAPIIENIIITGIKAQKIKGLIKDNFKLKSRSSFNDVQLIQEVKNIESTLKTLGYYFSKVNPYVESLENNMVIVEYKIELGDKAKIGKISFLGDKIFKDKKLKSIIVSEEYKFWKFISGKKYLQEQLISIDKRLLTNFYLNKGFYNVKINSSFAKLLREDEFEIFLMLIPVKKLFLMI